MRLTLTLALGIFGCSFLSAQDQAPGCRWGEGSFHHKITEYKVTISPVPKPLGVDSENGDCVVTVLGPTGTTLFKRVNFVISFSRQGELDKGEGPYVVFEAFEGGAHCCWRYWFVSLGKTPGRFIELYNERPATFESDRSGRTLVRTLDGAFDYFDGLCHACTVFPEVTLELRNRQLIDVSKRFAAEYDKEIAEGKQLFEREGGEEFAALKEYKPGTPEIYDRARASALTVVLAYLYSGREYRAWQALTHLWPASDQARIKKLILQTRAQGILSQIGSSKASADSRPAMPRLKRVWKVTVAARLKPRSLPNSKAELPKPSPPESRGE